MKTRSACYIGIFVTCLICVPLSFAQSLQDTSWRLLNITSMDDNIYLPAPSSEYTLRFMRNGQVSIVADCNRGTGRWESSGPSQLRFGPIATTRAQCSPESLSQRYLSQFEWVRSFVMEDGHLFLATMADGAIIEFEPMSADE